MLHFKNVSLVDLIEVIGGVEYSEEWRPVIGYEGLYEISSFGRVKRLPVPYRSKGNIGRTRPVKIMCSVAGKKKKYLKISLRKNGKATSFSIHRLVALHFIPLVPNKLHVNHVTGDKYKNHFTQLEWCTPQENNEHGVRMGLLKRGRNIKPYVRKGYPIGNKKIIDIKTLEIFAHVTELSKKTGRSIKSLRRSLSGERYNDTPYRYLGEEHLSREKPRKIKHIPFVPYSFGVIVSRKELTRSKNPYAQWKRVVQMALDGTPIAEYKSIKEAARNMGATESKSLQKLLNGRKGKTYKGYKWRFAE